jgi:amino acid transporter
MTESSGMPPARPSLIRAIGKWALTAAVINGVIGSGVFGLPSAIAGFTGQWSPFTVLLAGAGIFVIVLCFAEVGCRFDEAGGPYLYTRNALGPAVGFQVGWLHIWTRVLACAAVLNVLTAYLSTLIPWVGTTTGRASVMIGAIAIVTFVNLVGVRQAAWTVNAFTVAKLLPLVLVILLGLAHFSSDVARSQAVATPSWTDAVLILMFGYGGFESGIVAGSESRDPKRDTAFALVTAMLATTAIYFLMQIAVIGVLPAAAASKAPVAETLGTMIGPVGMTIGSIAVIISVYGWLTGFSLMSPRIFYSMAARGELPASLAWVHPKARTPSVAIVVNSAVGLGLGLASNFSQLATFSAIARLGIYTATCLSLIVLRRRHGMPQGFRAPGGAVLAVVGIGFCIWLLSTRKLSEAGFLPVMIAVGALIRFVMLRRTRMAPAT